MDSETVNHAEYFFSLKSPESGVLEQYELAVLFDKTIKILGALEVGLSSPASTVGRPEIIRLWSSLPDMPDVLSHLMPIRATDSSASGRSTSKSISIGVSSI